MRLRITLTLALITLFENVFKQEQPWVHTGGNTGLLAAEAWD